MLYGESANALVCVERVKGKEARTERSGLRTFRNNGREISKGDSDIIHATTAAPDYSQLNALFGDESA
ncbi:hypothetical protein HZB94_04765 [Candidatus Falkowbacteria bacterium]|nr:hypothetical protein [Candidatus Falkowbacteria bacterium]